MFKSTCHDKKIIVVHEFNGPKYFEALIDLSRKEEIEEILFVESSVIKQFVRNLFRDKKSIQFSINKAFQNLKFRLQVPFIKNKVIILGIPPWDYRMLWYGNLAKKNRLIYHTSWPNWEINKTPRQYSVINYIFKHYWYKALQLPNTQIVTVISEAANHLKQRFPQNKIYTIPHVSSSEFNKRASKKKANSFGILFVGELIEKKGINILPELVKQLADYPVHFGIVGTGPLKPVVDSLEKYPNVTVYGKVNDRQQLAEIYAQHHTLLVPSQKTNKWEELFGMVIIEAMSAGLPVIASNHVGPRSIISDSQDGFLIPEGSMDNFVSSTKRLLEDPVTWEEMSANAQISAKKYSLETVSDQWLNLLSD